MSNPVKSWASSLLFIASKGWYSQVVVSLDYETQMLRIASMEKETPHTCWMHSGVLFLTPQEKVENKPEEAIFIDKKLLLSQLPLSFSLKSYSLYFCTPFDFIHKQPVAGTQHKLLR